MQVKIHTMLRSDFPLILTCFLTFSELSGRHRRGVQRQTAHHRWSWNWDRHYHGETSSVYLFLIWRWPCWFSTVFFLNWWMLSLLSPPLHRSLGWSLAWCSAVPSRGPGTTSENPHHPQTLTYLCLSLFCSHTSVWIRTGWRNRPMRVWNLWPAFSLDTNILRPALKTLNRIKGYF